MEIFKEFGFESAHSLPNVPEGHKCARLHGHSFRVRVVVEGPVGDQSGWVMDFADLKDAVQPTIDALDHRYLNDLAGTREPHQRVHRHLDLGARRRRSARPGQRGGPRDLHQRLHLPGAALTSAGS